MRTIKINRGTKLNYDDVLENIAAVVYVENSTGCRPDLIHMAHIADRTETTDKGDLWYEGCFGNCIISLRNQKITDKLYLLNTEALKKFRVGKTHEDTIDLLEKISEVSIVREFEEV